MYNWGILSLSCLATTNSYDCVTLNVDAVGIDLLNITFHNFPFFILKKSVDIVIALLAISLPAWAELFIFNVNLPSVVVLPDSKVKFQLL